MIDDALGAAAVAQPLDAGGDHFVPMLRVLAEAADAAREVARDLEVPQLQLAAAAEVAGAEPLHHVVARGRARRAPRRCPASGAPPVDFAQRAVRCGM